MQPEIDFESILKAAAKASQVAYAPYSKYNIGAAVLCSGGIIFTGCNVENASYGLTICAEQAAVVSAVSAGNREITALAIVARPGTSGKATAEINYPYPCGACRQVLAEFCKPGTPVATAFITDLDDFQTITLGKLLPEAFSFSRQKTE